MGSTYQEKNLSALRLHHRLDACIAVALDGWTYLFLWRLA